MSLVHVIGDESIDHNLQRINFIFWIKYLSPSKKGEWVAIHVGARTRILYVNFTTAVDSV